MRKGSSCRGGTCIEYVVILGVLGSLIILLAGAGVRKIEISNAIHDGTPICRR